MNKRNLSILVLSIFVILLLFCDNSYSLGLFKNCLYKENRVDFSFDGNYWANNTSPQIDFYIPHKWINDDDDLNYLDVRLISTNLVLRHPLSSNNESNEINLPLNEMKIGWNRIYLSKEGDDVLVFVRIVKEDSSKGIEEDSRKFIQNVSLPESHPRSFHSSGLYSLVDCLEGDRKRYYKIRANSRYKVPFVLHKGSNKFDAFSENYSFSFEIFCSGSKRQVCLEGKNISNTFVVGRECEHPSVSSFSHSHVNRLHMYVHSNVFDTKDILNYNNFTFTELIFHNIGDTDFYIEIGIIAPSSAPISLLKVNESKGLLTSTSTPNFDSNDNTTAIALKSKEGNCSVVWTIMSSVSGILFILLSITLVCLYLKYLHTRTITQENCGPVDEEYFPVSDVQGYAITDPRVATGALPPDVDANAEGLPNEEGIEKVSIDAPPPVLVAEEINEEGKKEVATGVPPPDLNKGVKDGEETEEGSTRL